MTRFSFIHLSDTHLCIEPNRLNALSLMRRAPRTRLDTIWGQVRHQGFESLAKPASYSPDIISGVAQFCLQRSGVTDGILITGDIATTGMMSDILVARSFLCEPSKSGYLTERQSPTLNVRNARIRVLPGNHDKYVNNAGTPNCANFELTFAPLMGNFSNDVGHWIRRKNKAYLAFVFADFCLQSVMDASDRRIAIYGQGRVYADVLNELSSLLKNPRQGESVVIQFSVTNRRRLACGADL